jgi:hypothetical protein
MQRQANNNYSSNQMSATQVATPNSVNSATATGDNGLSFEVHEIEYEDDYTPTPGPHGSGYRSGYIQGLEDIDESPHAESPTSPHPLTRSMSYAITSPTAVDDEDANSSKPKFQCSPAMATCDGMFAPPPSSTTDTSVPPPAPAIRTHPNVKRLVFGDNQETIATLEFLASQGINTTALVTQHIMKYGSRARIAQTDDDQVVGFAMFDNEIDQEQLRDQAQHISAEELKQMVDSKPFIFLQLLMMSPQFAASTTWKEELVAQFCDCVTKNGKIAITRTEADNEDEIEFYRSCGFLTMCDMGIPSYPSSKGTDISVLAYTPLGKEGTSQIFKKFYSMGARF